MAQPFIPEMDFSGAPTISRFLQSQALVRIIKGPVGSGKTTACVTCPMMTALQQEPAERDFIRYFKVLIVRNTGPELKMTTIPSYQEIFPSDSCGPVIFSAPMRHEIFRDASQAYDEVNDQYVDVPGLSYKAEFIGLDKPQDIKRLLSYEGTMIYLNECRELPKQIFERGIERVGRYPSKDRGEPTFMGMIADTNPFDEDHYIAEWEKKPPAGYELFQQPPGVIQVVQKGNRWYSIDPGVELTVDDPKTIIHAAGKTWTTNPLAENLNNLSIARQLDRSMHPLGPGSYYARNISGKDEAQIRVYYQGRNGYVAEGVPVIPEYDDAIMAISDLPILQEVDLLLGIDVGGGTLNPSALFGQKHPRGNWLIHDEVICESMGVKRFGQQIKEKLAEPHLRNLKVAAIYGDPAGERRDELFETKIFHYLQELLGIPCYGAPSNDPKLRTQSYKSAIGRFIDGKPGFLVNRERCVTLRKALSGKWHFKIRHDTQQASDQINKNHPWSDVGDAGGYLLLSGGEYASLEQPSAQTAAQQQAAAAAMADASGDDWNVW